MTISEKKVFLHLKRVDFRKSINGLSAIVQQAMNKDVFSGNYYVFCNKRKDTIKIIYYDSNGFCLWQKRLEDDKFLWPKNSDDAREINSEELRWLLTGLDFTKAHKSKKYLIAV